MPFDSAALGYQLTDEDAWDVGAYVNSQPRPGKMFPYDWPDISKKPYDHPFGPYTDGFSELQHRYGPLQTHKRKDQGLMPNKKCRLKYCLHLTSNLSETFLACEDISATFFLCSAQGPHT